jgi:AcrR family transcriptional regulator
MRDIAMAAHIAKASLFQYFGMKKDLYAYLLAYCKETLQRAFDMAKLDEIPDPFDRVMAAGWMKTKQLQEYPDVLAFVISAYAETDAEVADLLANLKPEGEQYSSELALRPDDWIKFKDGVDVALVMRMLLLMPKGYSVRADAGFDFNSTMEEFGQIVQLLKVHLYKKEYL